MATLRDCPKCQGSMEDGTIIDNSYGSRMVSSYVAGPADKGWMGVRLKGRKPIDIVTLRCKRCGFLESYAPPA